MPAHASSSVLAMVVGGALAFVAAGAEADPPSDQLMYEPMRFCPVRDPFGTIILIYAPLG